MTVEQTVTKIGSLIENIHAVKLQLHKAC